MVNRNYLFILFCFVQCTIVGQERLHLIWDHKSSSIANAENLLTVHRGLYALEGKLINNKYWKEEKIPGKTLGIGYRLLKTALLDFQIDYLTYIVQHEIFGHGYRLREYGYKDNRYEVSMFPPYGTGGGVAFFGDRGTRLLSQQEAILIRSGGMEATNMIAQSLQTKWMMRGDIHYRESLLFLLALNDYTRYIHRTYKGRWVGAGNDVLSYLDYVYDFQLGLNIEDRLTLEELAKKSKLNLINTFGLFSIYTYVKTFLWDGNDTFDFPMIKFGNVQWLPSIRFGLNPFGTSVVIENFFKKNEDLIIMSTSIGSKNIDRYWGGGIKFYRNLSQKVQIGIHGNFWRHPEFWIGGPTRQYIEAGIVGSIIGELNLQFANSKHMGLFAQLGYKGHGYIEGEQLARTGILRLGVSIYPSAHLQDNDLDETN